MEQAKEDRLLLLDELTKTEEKLHEKEAEFGKIHEQNELKIHELQAIIDKTKEELYEQRKLQENGRGGRDQEIEGIR